MRAQLKPIGFPIGFFSKEIEDIIVNGIRNGMVEGGNRRKRGEREEFYDEVDEFEWEEGEMVYGGGSLLFDSSGWSCSWLWCWPWGNGGG